MLITAFLVSVHFCQAMNPAVQKKLTPQQASFFAQSLEENGKNPRLMLALYKQAAQAGDSDSLTALSKLYHNGTASERVQADGLLERAVQKGSKEACYLKAKKLLEQEEYLQAVDLLITAICQRPVPRVTKSGVIYEDASYGPAIYLLEKIVDGAYGQQAADFVQDHRAYQSNLVLTDYLQARAFIKSENYNAASCLLDACAQAYFAPACYEAARLAQAGLIYRSPGVIKRYLQAAATKQYPPAMQAYAASLDTTHYKTAMKLLARAHEFGAPEALETQKALKNSFLEEFIERDALPTYEEVRQHCVQQASKNPHYYTKLVSLHGMAESGLQNISMQIYYLFKLLRSGDQELETQALETLQKLATQGYSLAAFVLVICKKEVKFNLGEFLTRATQNPDEYALFWQEPTIRGYLDELAQNKNAQAAYLLAQIYSKTNNGPTQKARINQYLKIAADLKHPRACSDLALQYMHGRDRKKSIEDACFYFTQCCHAVPSAEWENTDYVKEALAAVEHYANQRDIYAICCYLRILLYKGTDESLKKAQTVLFKLLDDEVKLYDPDFAQALTATTLYEVIEKAVNSTENPICASMAARLCVRREIVKPQDAIRYLTIASNGNDPYARAVLALRMINGNDVEKNEAQALKILMEEIEKKNCYALHYMGVFFDDGLVVPENKETSKLYLDEAIRLGCSDSLAYCSIKTLLKKNPDPEKWKEAFEVVKKEVRREDPTACFILAELYRRGVGVPKDFAAARTLYETAKKYGYQGAAVRLGAMAVAGLGFAKPDYDVARKFFEEAVLEKDATAYQHLAHLSVLQGKIGDAMRYYEKWAEVEPANPSPLYALVKLHFNPEYFFDLKKTTRYIVNYFDRRQDFMVGLRLGDIECLEVQKILFDLVQAVMLQVVNGNEGLKPLITILAQRTLLKELLDLIEHKDHAFHFIFGYCYYTGVMYERDYGRAQVHLAQSKTHSAPYLSARIVLQNQPTAAAARAAHEKIKEAAERGCLGAKYDTALQADLEGDYDTALAFYGQLMTDHHDWRGAARLTHLRLHKKKDVHQAVAAIMCALGSGALEVAYEQELRTQFLQNVALTIQEIIGISQKTPVQAKGLIAMLKDALAKFKDKIPDLVLQSENAEKLISMRSKVSAKS